MHVPIRAGDEIFGVFGVNYCAPHDFSAKEQRVLEALAQRAGLAIQNARLYEQAQHVAVLEERQRLARELHDAVTQTLFSASLIAEVAPRIWEKDPRDGRARLEELRTLTRGALAEMRALLLELRPARCWSYRSINCFGSLWTLLGVRRGWRWRCRQCPCSRSQPKLRSASTGSHRSR
jgi:signal transduction histidine kinase